MKAYLRSPQERGKAPMNTLLFLGEDIGYHGDPSGYDCLVGKREGGYFFDWGLDGHKKLSPQIVAIRGGRINETRYNEVDVDGELARATIRLGESYRAEMQGNGERVTVHEIPWLSEKTAPQEFQTRARELYDSVRKPG